MNADRFAAVHAALTAAPSRRTAVRVLGGLGLAGRFGQADARKKKKRKKKCAKAGQPTSKKRKQCCSTMVKDATGRCTPRCTPTTCAADEICLRSGLCQPCTVLCSGTPAECGSALQFALDGGGAHYVCPGAYRGNFVLFNEVTVIGAGEGDSPASNTILDAGGTGRVVSIANGVELVTLERLRLTGGNSPFDGGGIYPDGNTLRMIECTVSGNTSVNQFGGGIFVPASRTLEMTRCTLRDNHTTGGTNSSGGGIATLGATTLTDSLVEVNSAAKGGGGLFLHNGTMTLAGSTQVRGNEAGDGGGIYVLGGGATLAIAETCRVTRNTAFGGNLAGGIANGGSTVTLAGANPSPIVVNNCQYNCDDVPKCAATPVFCPPA